jgi:hypothetical protein
MLFGKAGVHAGPHSQAAHGVARWVTDSPRKVISVTQTSSSRHSADSKAPTGDAVPSSSPHGGMQAGDLEGILHKLKLLEFGLFGLQQYGRNASLDVEDIGPFYRLAEEIQAEVLALQERLVP